jgi:hypothetical protein
MPDLPWPARTLFEMSLIGVCDGQQIVNIHHFEATTLLQTAIPGDQDKVDAAGVLADHWLTNAKTAYLNVHATDYQLLLVKCQPIEATGVFRHKLTAAERPLSTANVGTVAGGSDALQSAAVVRWRTPQAGKTHRGRTYIGPLTASWIASGQLSAGGTTPINSWKDLMITLYGAGAIPGSNLNQRLTIYSKPYNSGEYQYATRKTGSLTVVTPPDYAGNSTNVTVGNLDPIVRTQRRREVGVGS